MQSTILRDVIHKFSLIAQGDMRIKVEMDYPGDFAALKTAMQTTADNLNETLQ
jgi:methyl-accepting chemotaxis protein